MVVLRVNSFGTVKGLVGHEIVHGGELDATGHADKLHQRWRGRTRGRRTRDATLSGLTVMLLVGDKIFVTTKYDVALFTSA